jgi:hypothetical protein
MINNLKGVGPDPALEGTPGVRGCANVPGSPLALYS